MLKRNKKVHVIPVFGVRRVLRFFICKCIYGRFCMSTSLAGASVFGYGMLYRDAKS